MRINSISAFRPKTNVSFNGVTKVVTGKSSKDGDCWIPSKLLEDNKQFVKIGKKPGENIRPSDSGFEADFLVYYADPYEEITDETLENHSYVGVYAPPMRLFEEELSLCPTSKSVEEPLKRVERRMDYLTFMNDYAQQKIKEVKGRIDADQEELAQWEQRASETENYIKETSEHLAYVRNRKSELELEEKLQNPKISPEERRRLLQVKINMLKAQLGQ